MILSDTVGKTNQDWLSKVLKEHEGDVLRLYLVYDDTKMGMDGAREIWQKVAGKDFVAEIDSEIIENEKIRTALQQGVHYPVGETTDDHQWFLEIYVDDKELWDVVEG